MDETRSSVVGTEPARANPAEPLAPGGLWSALLLDGKGGATELDWAGIERWVPADGPLWVHLDPRSEQVGAWLSEKSGLSQEYVADFLREDPQPRVEPLSSRTLMFSLRGLALESERAFGELALLRMIVDPERLLSLCDRELPGVTDARRRYASKQGPVDLASLVVNLAARLGNSLQESAVELEDPIAELEYDADLHETDTSARVRELRGRVTRLRRHLAPFKIAVRRALELEDVWLIRERARHWRNIVDQAHETDSLLQGLYDRLSAVHDYVGERLARAMNTILYVLTIFSTILLPLTFVTGLFGMNIGIRGGSYRFMEGTAAFLAVTVALVVFAFFEYRFVQRRNLLPPREKYSRGRLPGRIR